MTVNNGSCVCDNPILTNINNTCMCSKISYVLGDECRPCPAECHFC